MRGRERESKSFSHSLCPPQRPPVVEMGCNLGVGNFIHISHKGQGTPLLLPPRTGITRELTSGARSKSNTFVTASLNAGSQRLTRILKVPGPPRPTRPPLHTPLLPLLLIPMSIKKRKEHGGLHHTNFLSESQSKLNLVD